MRVGDFGAPNDHTSVNMQREESDARSLNLVSVGIGRIENLRSITRQIRMRSLRILELRTVVESFGLCSGAQREDP